MGLSEAYVAAATAVVSNYKGEEPFAQRLKKFFKIHHKYGARDRKWIAQLCYSYFRLGTAYPHLSVEEKMLTGFFLCADDPQWLMAQLRPAWNEKAALTLEEKLHFIGLPFEQLTPFPYTDMLSSGISPHAFSLSHLRQPDLFLRVRPGYEHIVKRKLEEKGIAYREPMPHCLALPNHTAVDKIIVLNKEAVVQDLSSQRTGAMLDKILPHRQRTLNVWDCCAASGGKSIMLFDKIPVIRLTVSDVRRSILSNLAERFNVAGIKRYQAIQADLSTATIRPADAPFDLIVADVPCSGSGTWGRTPEYLIFFQPSEVARYVSLQRSIVTHVIPQLKNGGYLLYITCSVFKEENENNAAYFASLPQMQLLDERVLAGYEERADTMYAALFKVL